MICLYGSEYKISRFTSRDSWKPPSGSSQFVQIKQDMNSKVTVNSSRLQFLSNIEGILSTGASNIYLLLVFCLFMCVCIRFRFFSLALIFLLFCFALLFLSYNKYII